MRRRSSTQAILHRAILITALAAVLLGVAMPVPVAATTTIQQSWEQMADRADFIGLVECIIAGGSVARYRILESWHGPEKGTEVTLKVFGDPYGTELPITLCGGPIVVIGHKIPPHDFRRKPDTDLLAFRRSPIFCRDIPADYWQEDLSDSGVLSNDLMREQVRTFLSASPDEHERLLLLSVARVRLNITNEHFPVDAEPAPDDPLYHDLIKTRSTADFLNRLLAEAKARSAALLTRPDDKRDADRVKMFGSTCGHIIAKGGSQETLAWLQKLAPSQWPFVDKFRDLPSVTQAVQRRLLPQHTPQAQVSPPPAPNQEELQKAREDLAADTPRQDWARSFDLLVQYDPTAVADVLMTWQPDRHRWPDYTNGYLPASAFAMRCSGERKAHFVRLLNAAEPFIRTTAAVYLCFEDLPLGMEKLRALTALEGDAGAWAAVVLATRGDKTSVPRAMEVFAPGPFDGDTHQHRNLQARLRILFSNSAKSSQLDQPPYASSQTEYGNDTKVRDIARAEYAAALLSWWQTNAGMIQLVGPWQKILDAQKVD